jgi:hypothetical protein
LLLGKLSVQGCFNAVTLGALVNIQDQLSKQHYLVDSGDSFSIFPHHSFSPARGPLLTGTSGKNISCWGEKVIDVSFLGCCFTWIFWLAEVQFPILGIEFLAPSRTSH